MEEYIKRKRKARLGKYLAGVTISILLVIIIALIYVLYTNININNFSDTQQVKGTQLSQTIETTKEEDTKITDVIEKVNESIVGISKLKNTGNTIFSEDASSKIGIGTGIIVSENGYILTNEHVSGAKYSNCYVTLSSRKKLSRKCSMVRF